MRRWWVVLIVVFVACTTSEGSSTDLGTLANPPATLSPPHTSAPPPTSPSPAVAKVKVPKLVGLSLAKARTLLESLGFDVTVKRKVSTTRKPGTVLAQSLKAGRHVAPGTLTLTVAKAPPKPPPPAPACHPSYEGACLKPDASDYDCAGGSGNGPYYTGRVIVVGPDVFDLDRDGDGIGCE
jgi:hypothetical protein